MRTIDPARVATLAAAFASIGTSEQLATLGITNARAASPRTASIDLPDGKYHLDEQHHDNDSIKPMVNRVKITADGDGKVAVRFINVAKVAGLIEIEGGVTELHTVEGLDPNMVGPQLNAVAGISIYATTH